MRVSKRILVISGVAIICLLAGLFIYYKNSSYQDNDWHIDYAQDIKNGDIRLLTFGLPDFELQGKFDSLAKTYGFRYDNLGCMTTEDDIAFADKYNAKVIEYLTSKNGVGWYEKFQKKLKTIELANERKGK